MKSILIIEDDSAIVKGVTDILTAQHFKVFCAPTGDRGLQTARRENIDVIILDLGLPDMDGTDVCAQLRKDGIGVPVLMLTSRSQETDKVLGLEIGADDYMTKPFSTRELVARIRALLRRRGTMAKEIEEYAFGDITVDFRKQETLRKGKEIKLSSREYDILKYFIQHAGEVVTRDMLLNDIWGYDQFPTTRTVDNYILQLRKKLEESPSHPRHLLTVHTAGYKFVGGEAPNAATAKKRAR